MRLPRKIMIGGKLYIVKRDKMHSEGHGRGHTGKRVITVGSKNGDSFVAFETFIHEVTEVCMLENNLRFNRNTNDDFFYMANHHELDRLTTDLANALRGICK